MKFPTCSAAVWARTAALSAAAVTLANGSAARADVFWEHYGTISTGSTKQTPLAYIRTHSAWSGKKQAYHVTFNGERAVATARVLSPRDLGPLEAFSKFKVATVTDFENDRAKLILPDAKTYVDEPLSTLPKRLRFNIWSELDPELGKEDPPQLTHAQRARMGREVRAVLSPVVKKFSRFYFRPLPEGKFIKGLYSHGYRFTMIFGPKLNSADVVRITSEWWIADPLPGDDEVLAVAAETKKFMDTAGGTSASMWFNEMPYIYLQALPQEMQDAWKSMAGDIESRTYGFRGTPVLLKVTLTPPPGEAPMGDVNLRLELTRRSLDPVDASLFQPPADAKKVELEPLLKLAENAIKEVTKAFQSGLDSF